MKRIILLLLLYCLPAFGQTNELRVVDGQVMDAGGPNWKTIVIPENSGLLNDSVLSFDGTIKPQKVMFQIPAIYNFSKPTIVTVNNLPYSPTMFRQGQIQTGVREVPFRDIQVNSAYGNQWKMASEPQFRGGLILNHKLVLHVYQQSSPRTNYNAVGAMTIIPAAPIFDCGLPFTNRTTEAQTGATKPN
jgi:hypothetical protein